MWQTIKTKIDDKDIAMFRRKQPWSGALSSDRSFAAAGLIYLTGAAGQVIEVIDRVTLDALERAVCVIGTYTRKTSAKKTALRLKRRGT